MAKEEAVNRSQAIRDYYKSNHKATTQEVIDSLAKQGITVNAGLVYAVKGRHNQRVAARKTAKKAAEATAKAKTNGNLKATDMKPEVNKMQAARDYLKANKKAKAQEVVDALAQQGITTTVGYVRTIKAKSKTRRKAVKAVVAAAPTGIGVPEIKAALKFIKEIGGVAAAKQALAAADEIKKIV